MTTDQQQAAINADAVVWLADLLEHSGLDRGVQRAEHVVRELIDRGIGRAEPIPPLRPANVASQDAVDTYMAQIRATLRREHA